MISQQADRYISLAKGPNYLGRPHAANFRPNIRARFDLQPIDLGFKVEKSGHVTGFARRNSNSPLYDV